MNLDITGINNVIVVSSVILPIIFHNKKRQVFTSTTAVGMAYLRYSGVIVDYLLLGILWNRPGIRQSGLLYQVKQEGLLSAKEYRVELYQ